MRAMCHHFGACGDRLFRTRELTTRRLQTAHVPTLNEVKWRFWPGLPEPETGAGAAYTEVRSEILSRSKIEFCS